MKRFLLFSFLSLGLSLGLSSCSPEVGGDKWCESLKETPKGDWTIDETKSYTKHCLFK